MGRKILALGLLLAALAVGLTVLHRRQQAKSAANEAANIKLPPMPTVPAVPSIRGKPVADFELPNLQGAKVHASDFKNKVVLVNFWATWCAPCIVEIPWFIEFQKKYGPQGLEIVGISMDEPGDKGVIPFVKKHNMTYTVLLGDDKVADQFGGLLGLPTTFLVDRDGKYYSIHRGLVSRESVEEELQTLLGKPDSGPAASPSSSKTQPTPAREPEHRGAIPASGPAPAAPPSQRG